MSTPSAALAATLIAVVIQMQPAGAATLVVDTTSNADLQLCTASPGDCSLRGAINRTGGTAQQDNIHFAIPASDAGCSAGVCTIRPLTVLPFVFPGINGSIVIDGYTQPGATPNTATPAQGLDTQIKVELDGSLCNNCTGLILVRMSGVRGLAVGGFAGPGLVIDSSAPSGGAFIEGSFIGTDASGVVARPNRTGISAQGNPFGGDSSAFARIGGSLPAQRNLISGNLEAGADVAGISHSVLGNLIGTDRTGTLALPNREGLRIRGGTNFSCLVGNGALSGRNVISGNTSIGLAIGEGAHHGTRVRGNLIGTSVTSTEALPNALGVDLRGQPVAGSPVILGALDPAEANVVAFNTFAGVRMGRVSGFAAGNRYFGNGGLGLALVAGDDGVSASRNVNDPGDPDSGVNQLQNAPELSAFGIASNTLSLSYRVDSATSHSAYPLRIEFYRADGDEGRDFLGADSYEAQNAAGAIRGLELPIPAGLSLGADDTVVATATDAQGNTSEFSFALVALAILPPVASSCARSGEVVFCSGFEVAPLPSIEVGVRAQSSLFKPNGVVRLSDNRGASCTLRLRPAVTTATSLGSCVLGGSAQSGPITITAEYDTFSGAFGSAAGGPVSVVQSFNLP